MKISILTVFPQIFESFLNISIIKRAIDQGLLEIQLIQYSQLCPVKERIDEPTAGPGCGMIIKPDIIQAGMEQAQARWGKGFTIFFTPQGKRLDQPLLHSIKARLEQSVQATAPDSTTANDLHLILVSTRYEGIDARVEATYADEIISIGDYVLMGGDLPAQVFLEAFLRLIPNVVGNKESVDEESFSGALLDHPQYGNTQEWQGQTVPEIIKSGNHAAIKKWRHAAACKNTLLKRFDWFREHNPTPEEVKLARTHIPAHYVVLMHSDVKLKGGATGTSSVASLDIHDIARSSTTFGLKGYFLVTPLNDQRELINTFLGFWRSQEGKDYNATRYQALASVQIEASLDEVVEHIFQIEKQRPILIATGAHSRNTTTPLLDYHSQGAVWAHNRPVLLILGTAHGLADELINRCDYMLLPVHGLTTYNHLSVRSAAAIIFDRWFGLNSKLL
jgi:tRNA (guanine37-N1)-methyltransferase